MAKSMTGYGRSERTENERKYTVEIKSVNNRYLDVNIRLPRLFNQFEAQIRNELKNYISRGKVDVFISYEDLGESLGKVKYNRTIAREYMERLNEIAADFGLNNDVQVSRLSGFPDVLTVEEEDENVAPLWEPLKATVDEAAEQFLAARTREGEYITADLVDKLDRMLEGVDFISAHAPEIIAAYQKNLYDKIRDLLGDSQIDDSRVLQEVAIYSDKVCVDEELVRLRSHIEAVKDTLALTESVGRKLDFLAQEMNREANTILSKTDDVESANRAIELKTEIEKVREQIQNLE